MTCLTNELRDRDSPLFRWLDTKAKPAANRLIARNNLSMPSDRIMPEEFNHLAWVGTAFVYAFRWQLGLLKHPGTTLASLYCDNELERALLAAKTVEQKAIACLCFAAFEGEYRSGRSEVILDYLAGVKANKHSLRLNGAPEYLPACVRDLARLITSTSEVIDFFEPQNILDNYHLNPTFAGSDYLAADAQQIINHVLCKCFTTTKKQPFTKYHFYQQIAYVLMDWDNQYKIQAVSWYYPRQKAVFIYPVKNLFTDLAKLRREFRQMILPYYDDDPLLSPSLDVRDVLSFY